MTAPKLSFLNGARMPSMAEDVATERNKSRLNLSGSFKCTLLIESLAPIGSI